MNKIANRAVICEELIRKAEVDKDICVVVSDSRGSASLSKFGEIYPERTVEVGIAEQNLVGIAAGLASCGKKPYVASPACFLTMRSIEQIKVDVAYSNLNVKLIGISAGVSYGALGMTHHSLQDIAVINAIPNMHIVVPADRYETEKLMGILMENSNPTYIRVGRNPVDDIHENSDFSIELGKGLTMKDGQDVTIIAIGEMVKVALDAAKVLEEEGIKARVINMHTVKPLDEEIIIKAARETKGIITLEEHSINSGFGSMVAKIVSENCPRKMKIMGIPDEVTIAGNSKELFNHYGLTPENVANEARRLFSNEGL
ncbi:MAG: transketolase C-terminal domain-containing protein [Clostridium sp.]|nr:transketolase C-terminal domain-containing protein [Clostridium sp.]